MTLHKAYQKSFVMYCSKYKKVCFDFKSRPFVYIIYEMIYFAIRNFSDLQQAFLQDLSVF